MASSRSDGPNTQTNPEWRRKQNKDKKTTRTTFVDRFLVSPSVIRGVTVVLALSPFVALTVTAVTACRERNTTAKAGNPQRTTPEEPTRLTNILSDRPFNRSLLNLKKKKTRTDPNDLDDQRRLRNIVVRRAQSAAKRRSVSAQCSLLLRDAFLASKSASSFSLAFLAARWAACIATSDPGALAALLTNRTYARHRHQAAGGGRGISERRWGG